ncbi:hypothetical protein LJC74_08720 [Eubacteriales bacterium OttesenSCG-928-A19]|nr:hypothetical protein [Eubacteriales bacterium OttesenSCG-928-A19]
MWAEEILSCQRPDGLWGDWFHTLAVPRAGKMITTEQALRRLWALGFTAQDASIARALDTLRASLRGERTIPDRREVTHDWDLFTRMMLAAWLRLFLSEDPDACAVADEWAGVLAGAFEGGEYDRAAYARAYTDAFGKPPRGVRFEDFCQFYVVVLACGRLAPDVEARVFAHILRHPEGIYYVYHKPLAALPETFASREASRYLGAMELLARYRRPACRERLAFVADWLCQNRGPDGWDMGASARDGVYFPLSDSWRTRQSRVADCTARVEQLLLALQGEGT